MGDVTSFPPKGPASTPDLYLPPPHALERDDWSKRRLRLDLTLLLLSGLLSYIVIAGRANAVDQLVVPSLVAGIVSLIAAYVFGAVWDYKSFMSSIAQMSNGMTDARERY